MEELLEALTSIVGKQKSYLNKNFQAIDLAGGGLDVIEEQTEEETLETAKDKGIAYKIARIQERISQIEENDVLLVNKYRADLKELAHEMNNMTVENDNLKNALDDIKEQLNEMKQRENYDSRHKRFEQEEREREMERRIELEQKNYNELSVKFANLQSEFFNLESYLKSLNLSKEQVDLDQLRRELRIALEKNEELENRIQRYEKLVKDKEALIAELTRNVSVSETQLSNVNKEKETVASQRNSAEARLKVVQNTVKSLEREKERLGSVILKKDQYIEKLEIENRTLASELEMEKRNSSKKLDDINNTLQELSRQAKAKDTEIDLLRNARAEFQNECQTLMRTLFEKDKEISMLLKEKEELLSRHDSAVQSFDEMYRKKMEDNFSNMVAYIEEKENEIENLRRRLAEKESESSFLTAHESRKLREMESMMLNLSRELRQKEEENQELKMFVENYKAMLAELNRLNQES